VIFEGLPPEAALSKSKAQQCEQPHTTIVGHFHRSKSKSMKKSKVKIVFRNAVSGRFVKPVFARKNKRTTVQEKIRK
jgi:hypothetical protein